MAKKQSKRSIPKAARKKSTKKPTKKAAPKRTKKAAPKKAPSKKSVKKAAPKPPTREEKERERKAVFAARRRSENANIGSIPPIKPEFKELREACENDLVLWHTEVFKNSTGLKPFGSVQLQSIGVSHHVLKYGGLVNKLEPRSYGKTTRTIQEAIYGVFYGLRRFVGLCGSNKTKTSDLFSGIKTEIETNDVLFGMFPEICYPLRRLEGRSQRAQSQHINGKPTNCVYEKGKMVLPTVAGSAASGGIIGVQTIENVRGLQHRTETGGVIRADLYLLDDIQTDKSARSPTMIGTILDLINNSVLFGGSLFDQIAVLNLATIIRPDDVPDTLSDDPSWVTVRYEMLTKPAKNEDWWFGPYAKILLDYKTDRNPIKTIANKEEAERKARDFYLANRDYADEGAEVSWEWAFPWRHPKKLTVSAIQQAYNIRIRFGEETFACECQNRPIKVNTQSVETSKVDMPILQSAISEIPKNEVPADHTRLVSYVDVHKNLLYWVVVAKNLAENFRHVVSYGVWPNQSTRHFTLEKANRTIPMMPEMKGLGPKGMVSKSLKMFLNEFCGHRFRTTGGAVMNLDEVRVDANWGPMEPTIKKVLREHRFRHILWACHGIGIPATKNPMNQWKRKPGEEKGDGFIRQKQTAKAVQTLLIDTNQWKTETHNSLATPAEKPGSLSIFYDHFLKLELFFEHLLIEKCVRKFKPRDCEEWENPKGGQNHWFDCLVGALVDDIIAETKAENGNRGTSFQFDIGL